MTFFDSANEHLFILNCAQVRLTSELLLGQSPSPDRKWAESKSTKLFVFRLTSGLKIGWEPNRDPISEVFALH